MLTTTQNRYGFPTLEIFTSIEYPLHYLENNMEYLSIESYNIKTICVDFGDCCLIESKP
jgi:hypothetical protein